MQSANPIGIVEEVRPEVGNRTRPTTGPGIRCVFVGVRPEPNTLWLPLPQGARPHAPLQIVSDEPADLPDPFDFENTWVPQGKVSFMARKMDWPKAELEY